MIYHAMSIGTIRAVCDCQLSGLVQSYSAPQPVRLGQKSDFGASLNICDPPLLACGIRDIGMQKQQVFLRKAARELKHCDFVCYAHQAYRNRPVDLRLASRPDTQELRTRA